MTSGGLKNIKFAIENNLSEPVIGKIPYKRIFSIKVKYENQLTPEGLKKFLIRRADALKWTFAEPKKHLKNPWEIIKNSEKFIDETLRKAVKTLKKAKKIRKLDLQSIDIYYKPIEMTDSGLNLLAKNLKTLRSLKGIFMSIKLTREISDMGLFNLNQGLKRLRFLQNICLDFAIVKDVPDKGLDSISKTLRRFNRLQTLYLSFMSREALDLRLRYLVKSLKRLTSIRKVSLSFKKWIRIRATEFKYLAKVLKNLICLEEISLRFYGNWFSDKDVDLLCNQLEELDSLKSLTLVFQIGRGVTQISLGRVCNLLKKLEFLERIALDLSACNGKINAELIQLGKVFEQLKLLSHIKINIHNEKARFGERALSKIVQSVFRVEELGSFHLDIRGSSQGIFRGRIKEIYKEIEEFATPRNIDFTFLYE